MFFNVTFQLKEILFIICMFIFMKVISSELGWICHIQVCCSQYDVSHEKIKFRGNLYKSERIFLNNI